jgi:hypothetical protein
MRRRVIGDVPNEYQCDGILRRVLQNSVVPLVKHYLMVDFKTSAMKGMGVGQTSAPVRPVGEPL